MLVHIQYVWQPTAILRNCERLLHIIQKMNNSIEVNGSEQATTYASRASREAELNHSVSGIGLGVEKMEAPSAGTCLYSLYTDHTALSWMFNAPKIMLRLSRGTLRLKCSTLDLQKGVSQQTGLTLSDGG